MSKYKVPTTKISCRVETDKLQKLLNDSGLSVSQLIDNLIDEKVSDNLRFDEEKERPLEAQDLSQRRTNLREQ